MHDADGHIAIAGFYDNVRDWGATARDADRSSCRSTTRHFATKPGSPALFGEKGYTTLERLWMRPTCEVNGLLSGYTGEGAKTVLPAKAMAKVSCRLVPDQTPEEIEQLMRAHVAARAPAGRDGDGDARCTAATRGAPTSSGPLFDAARRALATAFDREPVITGEGGSIPVVGDFQTNSQRAGAAGRLRAARRERPRAERVDERGELSTRACARWPLCGRNWASSAVSPVHRCTRPPVHPI